MIDKDHGILFDASAEGPPSERVPLDKPQRFGRSKVSKAQSLFLLRLLQWPM
jgi:hypothetical protein